MPLVRSDTRSATRGTLPTRDGGKPFEKMIGELQYLGRALLFVVALAGIFFATLLIGRENHYGPGMETVVFMTLLVIAIVGYLFVRGLLSQTKARPARYMPVTLAALLIGVRGWGLVGTASAHTPLSIATSSVVLVALALGARGAWKQFRTR
jgi:hypothetical protein